MSEGQVLPEFHAPVREPVELDPRETSRHSVFGRPRYIIYRAPGYLPAVGQSHQKSALCVVDFAWESLSVIISLR